jgi:hypothetical protein
MGLGGARVSQYGEATEGIFSKGSFEHLVTVEVPRRNAEPSAFPPGLRLSYVLLMFPFTPIGKKPPLDTPVDVVW